jgi:hypothetical protein
MKFVATGLILFSSSLAVADFRDRYLGLNFSVSGANGVVTDDLSSVSVEYQYIFDYLDIFPTESEYHWYLDYSLTMSAYDLKDPLFRMGILDTPLSKSDLKAKNFIIEIGAVRRQAMYSFSQWLLGVRLGGVVVQTSGLAGYTQSNVQFDVNSSTSLGMTISMFSGFAWDLSDNFTLNTLFYLRKHYQADFAVRDEISKRSHRYPDYTSLGFGVGLSRAF